MLEEFYLQKNVSDLCFYSTYFFKTNSNRIFNIKHKDVEIVPDLKHLDEIKKR